MALPGKTAVERDFLGLVEGGLDCFEIVRALLWRWPRLDPEAILGVGNLALARLGIDNGNLRAARARLAEALLRADA